MVEIYYQTVKWRKIHEKRPTNLKQSSIFVSPIAVGMPEQADVYFCKSDIPKEFS
jgi:hypothetical protein